MASIQSKKSRVGKKTYYVVVSLAGKHKWLKAGTLKDAKLLKKALEAQSDQERLSRLGISARDRKIDEFLQEYLDTIRLRAAPNTAKRYKAVFNTFIQFLSMFHSNVSSLTQITPEIIESYQRRRLESAVLKKAVEAGNPFGRKSKLLPKPQTVNYEVNVLRSALIHAHDRDLIHSVPTRKVKPLKVVSRKQARIMSLEECQRFLAAAEEIGRKQRRLNVYAMAFRFMLNTGLRSGELCNLTWNDVDLETGLIQIRPKEGWTPKSYAREFFLNQAALNVLKKIRKREDFIFVNIAGGKLDNDDLRQAFIKVAKEAGFEGMTRVHDLRHTFNSLMQMAGVDPATMGKILGHKDIETTMIYTHQTQEHLKKSIRKIELK